MRLRAALLLASALTLAPAQARAQGDDTAALRAQVAALQQEIARLAAKVDELEARAEASPEPAAAVPPAVSSPAPAELAIKVAWKGAPEISAPGGWSFKPRGRMQLDVATVDVPAALAGNPGFGTAVEFRRVYLGVGGTLPGNFGYRLEADFAGDSIELTDVYLTYKPARGLTLTLGHQKPFNGLEDLTSDLFTSMLERGAFNSAFNFERRVGLGAQYASGDLLVQAGIFSDDAASLGSDSDDAFSLDGRVVFAPAIGSGRLHVGASAHYRDLNDASATVRYRARPFVHTTDIRLVDTGSFSAVGERNYGLELAYVRGPFHATVEGHRMTAIRPGLDNPSFWGGYAEVGMMLTPRDTTAYSGGVYDRIKPASPLGDGGIGAIQLNARYDRLDLDSGAIDGGMQQAAGLSLIWIPVDYVRFLLNYGHLWIDGAAVPAGPDTSYQVDTLGLRAQFDF